MSLRLAAAWVWVFGSIVSAATTQPYTNPATRPTTLTADQILTRVKQAERAYQNVYVGYFHTTVDELPNGQTNWQPFGITQEGSAWYDASPWGKARVYWSKNIRKWIGGTAPWVDARDDESWDGQEGRVVHSAAKPRLGWTSEDQAMIGSTRPPSMDFYSHYSTGIGFTLQYLVENEDMTTPPQPRRPLSNLLARYLKRGGFFKTAAQSVNGFDTIRLLSAAPDNSFWEAYWFDPSRGFALVKHEQIVHLHRPNQPAQDWDEGVDVFEFKEAGPGVWFPLRAQAVNREGDRPGAYLRFNFQAANAIANDPKFDNSIFQATIPTGYLVTDVRGNQRHTYIQMADGTNLELGPGKPIPSGLEQDAATRPDGPAYTGDENTAP